MIVSRASSDLPVAAGAASPARRAYCLRPAACIAGRRGCCALCQPHRGRTEDHVTRDELVVAARRGGMSLRRIAAAHAITHQRVLQILRNAGEAPPVRRAGRSRLHFDDNRQSGGDSVL